MKMLPQEFSQIVIQKINDFLWRQWSQLGIAGNSDWHDGWIIDPERLLLFTLDAGRSDARLFDEVMDWLVVNERRVSLQRLKGTIKQINGEQPARTLIAVARFMDKRTTKARWKALAQYNLDPATTATPFFYRADYKEIPRFGEPDPYFQAVGWLRSPIQARGLSSSVSCITPANMIFRLRALFGLNPRAEILAFLLTHEHASISDLMQMTGYSRPSIHETICDLLEGGFIEAKGKRNGQVYSIDKVRWLSFLEAVNTTYVWLDWTSVYSALRKICDYLRDCNANDVSDYILRSKSVRVATLLRDDLVGTGLPNPFSYPINIDNVLDEFPARVHMLLDSLNE